MWPKKKSTECKGDKTIKRLVTGLIIGGAIGSVVGKKLLEKHFAELVRHEYFILNYSGKKNLDSIMEEWKLKKNMIEKKDLYKMLYEIYIKRKKEKSKLIIKNCF